MTRWLLQGKIVAVKLSKNCKVYKVTATYWKRGSSQEDGDDVSMTLYEFLVVYIGLGTRLVQHYAKRLVVQNNVSILNFPTIPTIISCTSAFLYVE